MDFSKFFIDRPIFAIVLSVILLAAGLIAIPLLPIGEYPDVVPPSVVVKATYPGANPKEIADSVAVPLEEAIDGVEGIMYMKSVAGSDGTLQVVVTFTPGVDPDTAAVRVQNRVAQALSRLPEEVRQFGVTTQKQSPTPLMYVSVESTDGRYGLLYLHNYITLHIKDRLSRIPGVGNVGIFGSGDYAMRLWLDPHKLAARSLTAADVIRAVREQNVQVSAGQLGAEPSPNKSDFLISINVHGRLQSPEEFGDIVIKNDDQGRIVRLADVARVELGSNDYTLRTAIDGQPGPQVGIYLSPGANSLQVADTVYATFKELSKSFPPGMTYRAIWDPQVFVRDSISAVIHTLFEAMILVVLVVILFLQSWRASIIPLVAMPVSIVGTFAWLFLLGYSINTLTLFGLVLAIGIVVDDAIVVVENVERYIEQDMAPRDAAHQAMREVSGPIIAIALVLCAVFVPMAFLSGVTGEFYKQFAVTIAISTVISAISSLTLSPALAAKLLRAHGAPKDSFTRFMDRAFGWLFRAFNRFFQRTSERYHGVVGHALGRRGVVFGVYAGLLVATAVLFHLVPGGFIPTQDKLYLFAGAKLPEGASLARTEAVSNRISEIAKGVEGVDVTDGYAGLNALQWVNTPNLAASYVILKPFGERHRTAAQINADLSARLANIKDGFAYALMPPPIQGLGTGSGYSLYLEDRAGLGYGALQNAVAAFQAAVAKTPGMTFPVTSYQANIPQLEVKVDRVKAKAQGVSLSDLFETLQVYLGSVYVNDFNLYGRVYRVMAQADAQFRQDTSDIGNLHTRNAEGGMVPIGSMVSVAQSFGPDPVMRYNGYPAADIIGDTDPRVMSSGQAIARLKEIARQVLPRGIELEWTDLSYQQVTQGHAAAVVFPVAILLVFLVLASLYESWTLPLAVILIVPVCLCAALFGVWLTGGDNNVFVQVGLVVLMGLACKNAILIVEFARELEIQGRTTVEAALQACRLRLRPIVMTSIAFIAGSVPLMAGHGAGSEVRTATGITVFAGMLGVTLFGLFLTPVFYVALRKLAADRPASARAQGRLSTTMTKIRALALSISILLAGCATGPDYHRPHDAAPANFARAPVDAPSVPGAADAAFWQRFGDPKLSALVGDALHANHELRAALARYDAANAMLREAGFDRLPTVTAGGAASQERLSTDLAQGNPRSRRSYQAGINASWELDLFGRIRRSLEASRADTAATAHDVAALQVVIVAETARTYMQLRGAQERLRIARDNVASQQKTLDLVRASLQAGRASRFDSARARAQHATSLATIPILERDIALAEHRLAVLTGRAPEALIGWLDEPAPLPAIPTAIDPGTPADLLRRRPDVAAAEAHLHAATANVGVATADLFPRLSFGAAFGGQTLKGGSLASAASLASAVVLGIDWSFLDVGRVRARIQASRADARGMLEAYQGTVLHALEDTENALIDFHNTSEQAHSLADAASARGEAARVAHERYRAGTIALLELLDAERDLLAAQDAYAQAHTHSATSAVTLYQALAGGWPQSGEAGVAIASSP